MKPLGLLSVRSRPPAQVYNVRVRMNGGKKSGRGPGRPPKSSPPAAAMDGLAGIVEMVRKSEAERARLHGALTKMAAILREVLA